MKIAPIQCYTPFSSKKISNNQTSSNPIIYGISYDTVDFSHPQRTKTIDEIIEDNKAGKDISADKEALIFSRVQIAIKDAKEFVDKYPQFDYNDVCQDLILIMIESTEKELNGDISHYASISYANRRNLYFSKLLERDDRHVSFTKDYENMHKAEEEEKAWEDGKNERLREAIDGVLKTLTPREADIIEKYYELDGKGPRTYAQIAKQYGLSAQRIGGILARAERVMRHPSRMRRLKEFIEN